MTLDELYELLKEKRREMYEEGKQSVEISQDEFFEVFRIICYLKQMKFITDNM